MSDQDDSGSVKFFDHKTYPRATIKLKPSRVVKGEIGAFAMRNFAQGEIIVRSEEFQDNNQMTINEYYLLDKETRALVKAHGTITIETVYMPENLNHLRAVNYFNHSCSPNIGFDEEDNYIAVRNIRKGEELLLDYSFLNTNPRYRMKCCCGAIGCRGVVTGTQWKDEDYVRKFYHYFCSTVKKLLQNSASNVTKGLDLSR